MSLADSFETPLSMCTVAPSSSLHVPDPASDAPLQSVGLLTCSKFPRHQKLSFHQSHTVGCLLWRAVEMGTVLVGVSKRKSRAGKRGQHGDNLSG